MASFHSPFRPAGKAAERIAVARRREPARRARGVQVSVLTIDTIFRLLCHWHFVLRQCGQDVGRVAGQQGGDGQAEAGEDAAVQHTLRVRHCGR